MTDATLRVAFVRPRSHAQALAAARAVFECRLIVAGSETLDRALYEFEMALHHDAERLKERRR